MATNVTTEVTANSVHLAKIRISMRTLHPYGKDTVLSSGFNIINLSIRYSILYAIIDSDLLIRYSTMSDIFDLPIRYCTNYCIIALSIRYSRM